MLAMLAQHRAAALLIAAVVALNLFTLLVVLIALRELPRARRTVGRLLISAAALCLLVAAVWGGRGLVVELRARGSETSPVSVPGQVLLGRNAPLGGMRLFPDDHPWNTRVDNAPIDPASEAFLATIGRDTPLHADFGTGALGIRLYGIPYVVVDGSHTRTWRIPFDYAGESDDVPYPIPDDPPIESAGDRHLLILDRTRRQLYELFGVRRDPASGGWAAGSGATWRLDSDLSRPNGWTSADAAGLQILPGLARADEVYDLHAINHALRFGLRLTRAAHRYPARHDASAHNTADLPPMGLRLRLKSSVNANSFPAGAAVIVRALQQYGMILADNAGAMFLSGTADRRWKHSDLQALSRLHASDFEVVAELPPPRSDSVAWRERTGKQ